MPILKDIRDHEVLGREYKRGARAVLRRVLEKRFGPMPASVEERLLALNAIELENLAVRVLEIRSIQELFG